jgi:hypothetical protein
MSKDNDSICSAMSDVSISYNGEEMELDDAIDHIFKELQTHINQTHCTIREITQWDLRNESYDEVKVYFDEMVTHIKEGSALFKDLIGCIKQILPPKPKALKLIKE